jgi:polyphosphate kinase
VVTLEKPSEREQTQWYFQRYITHLPAGGEVMGFCTPAQYCEFMEQAPLFEQMLVDNGINLTKLWFSVSPAEQRTRFAVRLVDPVRGWKFSPMHMESVTKRDEYTAAKEAMFEAADTDIAPWIVVKSNDKKRARINAMRHILTKCDYADKDDDAIGEPYPQIVRRALAD